MAQTLHFLHQNSFSKILLQDSATKFKTLRRVGQRKNNLRQHAGQIAFPGGKKENEDKTLLETAVRETEEEISLSKENYDIIGNFPKFYTGTGYVVTPYIAMMKELSNW